MEYHYIDNGSDTLYVIFQSLGCLPVGTFAKIKNEEITYAELKEHHKSYNWMKLAINNKQFDYLFIEDFYSHSYGWYMLDHGRFVYETLNNELEKFLADKSPKYTKIVFFGSSKGGTGSLLLGMMNKYATHIFSLVPQIEVGRYISKLYGVYSYLFLNNDPLVELQANLVIPQISQQSEISKSKKFVIYTGENDEQFKNIIQIYNTLLRRNIDVTLLYNPSKEAHTPLVTNHSEKLQQTLLNLTSHNGLNKHSIYLSESVRLFDDTPDSEKIIQ